MQRSLSEILSLGDIVWLIGSFYPGFYFAFFTHEFGHYVAARRCGITPTVFRLRGCGPVYKQKHAGTLFILPLFIKPWANHHIRIPRGTTSTRREGIYILAAGGVVNIVIGCPLTLAGVLLLQWGVLTVGLVSVATGISQLIPGGHTDGQRIWNIMRGSQYL